MMKKGDDTMKYEVVITYEEKHRYFVEAENEEEAKKIAQARDEKDDDNDGMCWSTDYDVCVVD